jgi:SNF2 family DNA or RNA helicase
MEAKDYLELPSMVINDITIDLPPKARAQYDQLEREMFAEFDGLELEVFNAAALTAKCRQLANGAVRHHEREEVIYAHEAKLEALDEIMEEAAGQGVLIAYQFRSDLARIMRRYKDRRMAYLGPGVSDKKAIEIIETWNGGGYDGLCAHHLSAGHGLNIQHGGHQIVWFGCDFSLEGYDQLNGRLCRPGQPSPYVMVHRILARHTVDDLVVQALGRKAVDQDSLREAMKRYQKDRGY